MAAGHTLFEGEIYGARYNKLLNEAVNKINEELLRISAAISAGKVGEEGKIPFLVANREQIVEQVKGEFNKVSEGAVKGAYADSIVRANIVTDAIKKVPFTQTNLLAFKQVKLNNAVWFETLNKEAAVDIYDQLLKWTMTGDRNQLETTFNYNMDALKQKRYGKTIVKNHVKGFYQNAIGEKSKELDINRFRYIGPAPQRPFCIALFKVQKSRGGKGFTRQEIDSMNNGESGDVFITHGGYGCRHQWRPIAESSGEVVTTKEEGTVVKKLKKEGVYFGDKPTVLIRQPNGKDTGVMFRVVKEDKKGFFYKRFDGTRQGVTKEGNVFVFKATPQSPTPEMAGPAPAEPTGSSLKVPAGTA
ncbi:MAG: hypothetical protein JRL30_29475 [Deltaproteobacteria bacterium]|nr:hypothetical protein [Deltaproteobacteria bacterium]